MWLERSEGGTEHRINLCFVLASLYTLVLVRGWSDAYFIYKLSMLFGKTAFFVCQTIRIPL